MKTVEKTKYLVTAILDLRGREESAEQMAEVLKGEIEALNGEVGEIKQLGQQDFSRTPDRRFSSGHYVQIEFTAPALKPASLQERVRLNKAIDRVLVQKIED